MPKVPKEFLVAQYELKASYVSTGLDNNGYTDLFEDTLNYLKIANDALTWDSYRDFGISDEVFNAVKGAAPFELSLYLCHPNILIAKPETLRYYRCISVFSQKGLKAISGVSSADKIEGGRAATQNAAVALAKAINGNLSPIYRVALPAPSKLRAMMHATAGITLDGGWKNAIGSEGERVIKSVIIRHGLINGELNSVTLTNGKSYPTQHITLEWIDHNAAKFRSATFTNGSVATFGSEPDVTLFDKNGQTVAGVEVKAGLDPAGALERLGAMLKSFDAIIHEAPKAERILVVACLTDEVEARLKATAALSRQYSLTDIITNRKSSEAKFANTIRGLLGLVVAPH